MSSGTPTVPGGWDPHLGRLHFRGAHVQHHLRGRTKGRLRGHLVLVTFVVGLMASLGIGAVVIGLAAPGSAPLCKPFAPCGPPSAGPGLVNQTVWRSSQYGFRLEFPSSLLAASQQTGAGLNLNLQVGNSGGVLIVRAAPASVTPARAITAELSQLPGISQLSANANRADQLLGPGVGYRNGVGGVYTGYLDASQGVGGQQTVYAESATDGRVTVTVLAIAPSTDAGPQSAIAQLADLVVNSVQFS